MDFELAAEQRLIVETVSDFVHSELYPHEAEVERLDEVPAEVAAAIRQKAISAGLYAANMPAELGGGDRMGGAAAAVCAPPARPSEAPAREADN